MVLLKQFVIFFSAKTYFGYLCRYDFISKELAGAEQPHLQLMDIRVQRNAFGRQVESFQVDLKIKGLIDSFPAIFIRAPIIIEKD